MLETQHKNAVHGKRGIWAAVVAASTNGKPRDKLVTFRLHYPRMIHSEFMTHRMFSRNASSSRAIPVKSMLEQVREQPAMPVHWGKNQAGMQAAGEHSTLIRLLDGEEAEWTADEAWLAAAAYAAGFAEAFSDAGYHKQVCNRLIEPFQYMNVVVSATDWANFFALRVHPDADPNIRELAECMWQAYQEAEFETLNPGEWHTPYIDHGREDDEDEETGIYPMVYLLDGKRIDVETAKMVSVSCVAQSSYRKLDTSIEKAVSIYKKLAGGVPLHASPFEQVATPFSVEEYRSRWLADAQLAKNGHVDGDLSFVYYCGNFKGWRQLRKTLPNENIKKFEGVDKTI